MSRTSIAHWIIRLDEVFQPLMNLLSEEQNNATYLQANETRILVLKEMPEETLGEPSPADCLVQGLLEARANIKLEGYGRCGDNDYADGYLLGVMVISGVWAI